MYVYIYLYINIYMYIYIYTYTNILKTDFSPARRSWALRSDPAPRKGPGHQRWSRRPPSGIAPPGP